MQKSGLRKRRDEASRQLTVARKSIRLALEQVCGADVACNSWEYWELLVSMNRKDPHAMVLLKEHAKGKGDDWQGIVNGIECIAALVDGTNPTVARSIQSSFEDMAYVSPEVNTCCMT